MKLLMISGDRSILSGQQGAFWYTLQEMRKHWDRIDIICPRISKSGKLKTESGKSQAHDIPNNVFFHPCSWGLLRQSLWIEEKGKRLIAEHHHDVMTVHEYPPFYNGRGALALHKKTGIPFALEIHHIVGWPVTSGITEWVGRELSRWVLPSEARRARKVRTVSTAIEEELKHWGIPSEKLSIIPSFYLDHDLIGRTVAPPKSYDIAFCARLVPNKGLMNVIRSLEYLPDARLLVIGDGPMRAEADKLIHAMKIQNHVTFLGWLPTLEAVLDGILAARTFVMASTSEGGPRSALEAMACGMPVIATRVGVMPEVIEDGENGLFTDGSPKDIAAKVEILLKDAKKREHMGKAARKILDRFERGKLVEKYAEFLKGIAKKR